MLLAGETNNRLLPEVNTLLSRKKIQHYER